MKHFLIDKNYGTYLSGMGFSMDEVLKKAMLPEDLFARQTPSLTAEEYFRFMGAIDALSPDDQTPIRLAALEGIAAFSPPIFAAYCSRNVLVPFISRNESMWEFFEPELKRRLSMMETDDSCAARVRSALMELLPSGECTIDDVARKLGYSKRSLQRKLQEEDTSFQKQLGHTRELLAKTYLANTDMTAEDIAFLLGYQEIGSFLRAFTIWTGQTVSEYRQRND